MASYRTGGEVDALCTRCKMVLAHTILALEGGKPARVQCNTCHGQHNFRGTGSEPRSSSSSSSTPKAPRASSSSSSSRAAANFEQELVRRTGPTRTYSPKSTFAENDLLTHPTFGRGYVAAVRADKIDVNFAAGIKTLVHAKG